MLNVTAVTVPDINVALNVVTVVGLVCGVPLLARAARLRAVISDLEAVVRSLKDRVGVLEKDLADERNGRTEAVKAAAAWEALYMQQEQYTARPALEEVRDEIKALHAGITTALDAQGNLIIESNSLLAQLRGSFGFRSDDRPQ